MHLKPGWWVQSPGNFSSNQHVLCLLSTYLGHSHVFPPFTRPTYKGGKGRWQREARAFLQGPRQDWDSVQVDIAPWWVQGMNYSLLISRGREAKVDQKATDLVWDKSCGSGETTGVQCCGWFSPAFPLGPHCLSVHRLPHLSPIKEERGWKRDRHIWTQKFTLVFLPPKRQKAKCIFLTVFLLKQK